MSPTRDVSEQEEEEEEEGYPRRFFERLSLTTEDHRHIISTMQQLKPSPPTTKTSSQRYTSFLPPHFERATIRYVVGERV